MNTKRTENEASKGRHSTAVDDWATGRSSSRKHLRAAQERRYATYSAGGQRGYAAAGVGRKRMHPAKVIGIMLLVVAVLMGGVYVAGALFFDDRFYPNTSIGDVDVSLLTHDAAEEELAQAMADYTLTISGQGLSVKLSAEEAALEVDESVVVRDVAAQKDSWRWPLQVLGDHDGSECLVAGTDEDVLEQAVRAAVESYNETASKPKSATAVYDEDSGLFVVKQQQAGTTIDADQVVALATEALLALEKRVEIGEEQLEQPAVLADDEALVSAVEEANTMLSASLVLTLGDEEVAEIGSEQVCEWVGLSDDLTATLDTAALTTWVEDVAEEWDTVGTTRTYTRADGKEVSVTGGDWGWSIDVDSLVSSVCELVAVGSTETVAVPYSSEGDEYNGAGERDWGARYLDVDLTEQHVYFYDEDDEVIWESDCVSGALEDDRETPTGVYSINMKESPSTLVGYDDDGEVSYESEVTYWMPFSGNSVGFHDATWQSAFGGTRYKDGYGSHGCVNLPLDAAEELYDIIEVGDVVVVHW